MRERLTILVIVGTRTDEHSLRSQAGTYIRMYLCTDRWTGGKHNSPGTGDPRDGQQRQNKGDNVIMQYMHSHTKSETASHLLKVQNGLKTIRYYTSATKLRRATMVRNNPVRVLF